MSTQRMARRVWGWRAGLTGLGVAAMSLAVALDGSTTDASATELATSSVFVSTGSPQGELYVHRTGRGRRRDCEPSSGSRGRSSRSSSEPAFVMGFSLFGGGVDREYLASEFGGGEFFLGAELDGRVRGQVEFGFRSYDDESLIGYSPVRNQNEWYIGGSGRFFFGPPKQGLRPYSMVGFTVGATTWDYTEPVLVDVYDPHGYWVGEDVVGDDRLWTGTVYAGGGASLLSGQGLELGINGRLGVQFYDEEMRSGLHNDLFEADAYASIGLEVGLISSP